MNNKIPIFIIILVFCIDSVYADKELESRKFWRQEFLIISA